MHPKVKEQNDKRLELGLTLYRIGKDLQIGIPTLTNFFQGLHEPKIGLYFKVKDYLDSK